MVMSKKLKKEVVASVDVVTRGLETIAILIKTTEEALRSPFPYRIESYNDVITIFMSATVDMVCELGVHEKMAEDDINNMVRKFSKEIAVMVETYTGHKVEVVIGNDEE
jgi:VanZ family protein